MLDIAGLRKAFGSTQALDGVSLRVGPGEMVGFVGANGAGKSTTMRIAMGLLAADQGTVRWSGSALTFAERRRFGYMPEERGLYPKMRVQEQVGYFGRLHGMSGRDADAAAGNLLERLSVLHKPGDLVQALSLGNQQRVQLAAALIHDPALLILDEPFSGLDPVGVDAMAEVLAAKRRDGTGVLFSSHQLDLVERLCDRVVIIRDGRVIASGTLDELRDTATDHVLELVVHAAPGWTDELAGVTVVEQDGARVLLRLDDPGSDQDVLAAAVRAGRVEQFGWNKPSLTQLYRDAVSEK